MGHAVVWCKIVKDSYGTEINVNVYFDDIDIVEAEDLRFGSQIAVSIIFKA